MAVRKKLSNLGLKGETYFCLFMKLCQLIRRLPQLWPFSAFCKSLVERCLGTFCSLDPTPNTPSLIITHHCWGQKESLVKPHTGVFSPPSPRSRPHLHTCTYTLTNTQKFAPFLLHKHITTAINMQQISQLGSWKISATTLPSNLPFEVWDCPTNGPVTHLLCVIKGYSGLYMCPNCPPSSGLGLSIATCELWRTGTLALVKFMSTATFSSWPTSLNRPTAL